MITNTRRIYSFFAWLFFAGAVGETLLAVVLTFGKIWSWGLHIYTGYIMIPVMVVMLLSMGSARIPRDTQRLTWILLLIFGLQVLTLWQPFLTLVIFHPIFALVVIAISWSLAQRSTALVQERNEITRPPRRSLR